MAAGHRAAEMDAVSRRHDAMNADLTTKPWMIPIEDLLELGPVGVLKPRFTTLFAGTRPSATSARAGLG